MESRKLAANLVMITDPISGAVEVQVPITVAGEDRAITITFNRHEPGETITLDQNHDAIPAYTRARTRLRVLLATSKDDHATHIYHRCCCALDATLQQLKSE